MKNGDHVSSKVWMLMFTHEELGSKHPKCVILVIVDMTAPKSGYDNTVFALQ